MKLRTLFLGLVLFVQFSCTHENMEYDFFNDDTSITSLNGTWKVIFFENISTKEIEFPSQENSWGKDIVVSFNDNLSPNFFSGIVTTNSVFGEFEYLDKRRFKLHRYGSTFVSQPEWAFKFGDAMIDETNSFKINQNQLRIYYENNTKSVTLKKE